MTLYHRVPDEVFYMVRVSIFMLHDVFSLQLDPCYLVQLSSKENRREANETDGDFA